MIKILLENGLIAVKKDTRMITNKESFELYDNKGNRKGNVMLQLKNDSWVRIPEDHKPRQFQDIWAVPGFITLENGKRRWV